MNNGLTAENLLLALPEALRQDEQMQALAAGIAEVLAARPAEIDRLLIYPRIDELRRLCWTGWLMILRWIGGTRNTAWPQSGRRSRIIGRCTGGWAPRPRLSRPLRLFTQKLRCWSGLSTAGSHITLSWRLYVLK